jgi:DNA-directed RNA polymerase subunit K/omega
MVLESSEYCEECGNPSEQCTCESIDEMSTTGGVPGYQTPNAFAKADDDTVEALGYKRVKESVNTPPKYSTKDESYQRPESEEEEYMDKFPFSMDDSDWQHKSYEYPSKDLTSTPGQSKRKDRTVMEMMEAKYEQLIEGYRDFRSGDEKPSKKVKNTIREIAKKLREIETLVEYNSRLKNESGVTSSVYGPSTTKALTEISKRLIKISERIRSLGE